MTIIKIDIPNKYKDLIYYITIKECISVQIVTMYLI